MRSALRCLAVAFVAGCHYQPTPVPTYGYPPAIAALAGTWAGTYRGTESGREGAISFTIRVGGDSAYGDVVMDWPPGLPVVNSTGNPGARRLQANTSRLLAIRFVSVGAGEVEGALEPYVAPDCECTVRTTFSGFVRGDTVRGTFVTRGSLIAPQTGVWAVSRR